MIGNINAEPDYGDEPPFACLFVAVHDGEAFACGGTPGHAGKHRYLIEWDGQGDLAAQDARPAPGHGEFVCEILGALLQALGADDDAAPEPDETPERRAVRIAAYLGERVDELHSLIAEGEPLTVKPSDDVKPAPELLAALQDDLQMLRDDLADAEDELTRWPKCPAGCNCRIGTDDADANECGCDGPCTTGWDAEPEPAPELAEPVTVEGVLCRDYPAVVAAMQAAGDRRLVTFLRVEAERDQLRAQVRNLRDALERCRDAAGQSPAAVHTIASQVLASSPLPDAKPAPGDDSTGTGTALYLSAIARLSAGLREVQHACERGDAPYAVKPLATSALDDVDRLQVPQAAPGLAAAMAESRRYRDALQQIAGYAAGTATKQMIGTTARRALEGK